MIKNAYNLINKYHKDQLDKGGNPYINHLEFVSSKITCPIGKVAALLHDIKEDTPITNEELLANGISQEVIDILDILTKKDSDIYMDYIYKIKNSNNPIAIEIKLADLTHNMDISRIPNPTEKDLNRIKTRYKKAYDILSNNLAN